jgi:hypothetical protein
MSYTRQDVIEAFTTGKLDHHKRDLLDCIIFLSKIKTSFTMDDIHGLLRKHGKNGRGRTGHYTTIVRAMVEMGLLLVEDGWYRLASYSSYIIGRRA